MRGATKSAGAVVGAPAARVECFDVAGALDGPRAAEIADALWARPVFELRLAATEVLIDHASALTMLDVPLFIRKAIGWILRETSKKRPISSPSSWARAAAASRA